MLSPGKGELLTPKPKLPEAPKEPWKRSVKIGETMLNRPCFALTCTHTFFCCLAVLNDFSANFSAGHTEVSR